MCVNLVVLRKLCEKSRCFLGKFTQLAQILHNRRSWRSRQISTLHLCLSSSIINSVIISSTLHLYDECYQISLSFNNDQSFNLSYFIIVLYYNDILIGDYIQGWRLCIHYYHHKRKPWHFDYIISCSFLIETLRKNCLSTFVRLTIEYICNKTEWIVPSCLNCNYV